jgi:hypothetical protein
VGEFLGWPHILRGRRERERERIASRGWLKQGRRERERERERDASRGAGRQSLLFGSPSLDRSVPLAMIVPFPEARLDSIPARELLKTGWIAAVVTAVAAVVFFGPGFATGAKLPFTHEGFGSDIWHQNLPFRAFYADELSAGRLPHWAPDLGTGVPLLAEGQVGALYPPHLLLHLLLPLAAAFNLSILLSFVLAGAFAAMCARELGARFMPSILAALVYAFCGFFVVHLKHPNFLVAAAYAPAIVLLTVRVWRGGGFGTVALLSIAIAMTFLAGAPQIAYMNLLMGGLTVLVLMVSRRPLRAPVAFTAATVLAILLAAPQLLPSNEFRRLGPRKEGLELDAATEWSIAPSYLVTFVAPFSRGDPGALEEKFALDPATGKPLVNRQTGERIRGLFGFEQDPDHPILFWETTAYAGILPLILAAAAIGLGFRRRFVILLGLTLALSIVLALGRIGGLYVLLFRFLPGFDLFRMASRFLLYSDLALALLAAIGLTLLLDRFPRIRPAPAAAVASVVAFLDLFLLFGDHNPMRPARDWLEPPATAKLMIEREKGRGQPFRYVTADPDRWAFKSAWRHARGWKGDLTPYDVPKSMLDPNLGMLWGLAEPSLYTPVPLPWVLDVLTIVHRPRDPKTRQPAGLNLPICRLLNVRYFIDPFHWTPRGMPVVAEFPGDQLLEGMLLVPRGPPYVVRLLEDEYTLPRAFLVGSVRSMRAPDARRRLLDPRHDARNVLILTEEEQEPLPPVAAGPPIPNPVEFLEYGSQTVRLRVDAPGDAWLFLGDTWYPGWESEVSGEPARVRRANLFGRAIRVPAGRHEVTFTFVPGAFRTGLIGTAAGVLVIAGGLWFTRRRRAKGRDAED